MVARRRNYIRRRLCNLIGVVFWLGLQCTISKVLLLAYIIYRSAESRWYNIMILVYRYFQ